MPHFRRAATRALAHLLTLALLTVNAAAQPVVLDDAAGTIAEVTLHFLADSADELAPTYRDLFRVLPPDVRIVVLCPDAYDRREFERSWTRIATARGRQVTLLTASSEMTIWARDRQIARRDRATGRRTASFVPNPDGFAAEDMAAEATTLGALFGDQPSPFLLEGGNTVANAYEVLIGINALDENIDAPLLGPLADEFAFLLGRNVRFIGADPAEVPWPHLDMYLAVLPNRTAVVASTNPLELPRHARRACPPVDEERSSIAEQLDDVACQMRQAGYHVIRTPAALHPVAGWAVTYTNILFEERAGRSVVYMPTFGIARYDEAAAAIYEELGFTVRRVSVTGAYLYGGALRCLVNVTERREPDRQPARRSLVPMQHRVPG